MQRYSSSFIAVCLFVVLGLLAPAVWAQQDEDAFRLDPLIVTATRSAERLSQTTRTVTVISAEDIAAQGAHTVADALRGIPGLDVVRTGSLGGTTSIFARGGESAHTAVLIDGVKVNLMGDSSDLAHLSVNNIERIEVLRGPASTLYGSAAVGGVIHIITKQGSGPLSADLNASGGSFRTYTQRAAVSAGSMWGGLSVSANRVESDGHLAFNNQYDNANLSLRADLLPDEHTNIDFTLRYTDTEYHFPTDGAGNLCCPDRFSTTHETALGLRGSRTLLPWWNSSVQLAFHRHKRRHYSGDGSRDTYDAARLAIDWQSALDFRLGNLTLGVAHEDDEGEDDEVTEANEHFRQRKTAGYAQLRLKPMEPMVLIGGLRVDRHSRFGTEPTYQVSAAYFLPSRTKLRATLGTGFREPNRLQIAPSKFIPTVNLELKPERSVTWELAVEQRMWEERLRLEGVFFSNRFRDLIEYRYEPPPGQSTYFNIEEAKTHGVELSATVTLLPSWTVGTAYTWLHTEDAEGEPLLRRPEHKIRLFGQYTRGRFDARVDLHHIGERADLDWPDRVDNPAYTKVNVALAYKLIETEQRTLELFSRVENLFDEDYEEAYGYETPGFAAFGGIRMTL